MATELMISPPDKIPSHVAIIMDGNAHWAIARGKSLLEGHRAGVENLRHIITACVEFGIQYLTINILSKKNWDHSKDDAQQLISLLEEMIDQELEELTSEGVRLKYIGRLEDLNPNFQDKMRHAINRTKHNNRLIANLALNYSGRDEIVQAARALIANKVALEDINEMTLKSYLYLTDLPEPELIIHTNGDLRISDFLVWQGTYAEDYVTPTFWPDFDKEELCQALWYFAQRDRRFGVLPQSKK